MRGGHVNVTGTRENPARRAIENQALALYKQKRALANSVHYTGHGLWLCHGPKYFDLLDAFTFHIGLLLISIDGKLT